MHNIYLIFNILKILVTYLEIKSNQHHALLAVYRSICGISIDVDLYKIHIDSYYC